MFVIFVDTFSPWSGGIEAEFDEEDIKIKIIKYMQPTKFIGKSLQQSIFRKTNDVLVAIPLFQRMMKSDRPVSLIVAAITNYLSYEGKNSDYVLIVNTPSVCRVTKYRLTNE